MEQDLPLPKTLEGSILAAEAGRRRLVGATAALEALCRRFKGFGTEHAVPEQIAALGALAGIGGATPARYASRPSARGATRHDFERTELDRWLHG
jgi:hypothetical protein